MAGESPDTDTGESDRFGEWLEQQDADAEEEQDFFEAGTYEHGQALGKRMAFRAARNEWNRRQENTDTDQQ